MFWQVKPRAAAATQQADEAGYIAEGRGMSGEARQDQHPVREKTGLRVEEREQQITP